MEWGKFKKRFIRQELEKNGKLICKYCGRDDLTENGPNIATIDHRIPSCKGGKDTDDNVAICCSGCNKSKSNLSVEEFEQSEYLRSKRRHIFY